jgi:adenine-specific DNA-methyltransferase
MTSLETNSGAPTSAPRSTILHGDCVKLMDTLPAGSVDFILTDPPYLVNYRPRNGQRVANDNGAEWLQPAAHGMYRLLKQDAFCVSFYGWTQAD